MEVRLQTQQTPIWSRSSFSQTQKAHFNFRSLIGLFYNKSSTRFCQVSLFLGFPFQMQCEFVLCLLPFQCEISTLLCDFRCFGSKIMVCLLGLPVMVLFLSLWFGVLVMNLKVAHLIYWGFAIKFKVAQLILCHSYQAYHC